MNKIKRISQTALIIVMTALLTACGASQKADTEIDYENLKDQTCVTQEDFAMDTYMTVTAYGEQAGEAVSAAIDEINRLDSLLSTGNEDSEIAKLNTEGQATLSEDSVYLYQRALEINEETGGCFNVAIYPLMDTWGFTSQNYQVPSQSQIDSLLPLVDMGKINFDDSTGQISFEEDGMAIDFGGIAKGYTSARIMDIFRDYGISSGVVSLGGNVQTYGTKTDGSLWKVGIVDPNDESAYLGILSTSDMAVITSGGYERYFEEDGQTYHHIIDPATGYPSDSGLTSVTIVSPDGTLADGLSTSLFIMGKDKAIEFWQEHSEEFDFILMTEDNQVYVSENIADNFESDYAFHIVSEE